MDARAKIQLYKSIYNWRPAGLHKHLHMLTISSQVGVAPSTLWREIEAMYNTSKADALDKELEEVDFHNQMVAYYYPELEERRLGDEDSDVIKSEPEQSESPKESPTPSEESPDVEPTGTRRRSSRIQAQVVPPKPAKTPARKSRKKEPEPEPEVKDEPEAEPEPSRALRPRRGRSAAPAAPSSPPAKKAAPPPKKKARRR